MLFKNTTGQRECYFGKKKNLIDNLTVSKVCLKILIKIAYKYNFLNKI